MGECGCGGPHEGAVPKEYKVVLWNTVGEEVKVRAVELDEVTQVPQGRDLTGVCQSFTELSPEELANPICQVDLLMGLDYVSYLPQVEKTHGHLLLLMSQFGSGRLLAGRLEDGDNRTCECSSLCSWGTGDEENAFERDSPAPKGAEV